MSGRIMVKSVFVKNGTGKYLKRNNHNYAKKDNRGIDFTSSRALNFLAYEREMPRQPASEELKTKFPELIGSIYGIVRGGVESSSGCKRSSALTTLDAYTDPSFATKVVVKENENFEYLKTTFFDQGSSSKPKEKDLKSNSKKKKGEDAADTSLFSKDNASERFQNFEAYISLDKLQFMQVRDPDLGCVQNDDEPRLLETLKKTFGPCGDTHVEIKKYRYSSAVIPTDVYGVLLSKSQINYLIYDVIKRYSSLRGFRASSIIEMTDFRVDFCGGLGEKNITNLSTEEALAMLGGLRWKIYLEEVDSVQHES